MNIFNAFILGIVEGVTEFLPISSTYHLIYTAKILGISDSEFLKLFEVTIQSGAILAVFLLYLKDMIKNRLLIQKVLASFLPTATIGFLLYKMIKNVFFEADTLITGAFIIIGLIFIVTEKMVKNELFAPKKSLSSLSYKDALKIGLLQSLSVIPGVSRAGIVILGMLVMGYKRDEAAYYSFFLAIPTIFAASIFDLYKNKEILFYSANNLTCLATGFATACIFAYLSMRWLIIYLKKHSLFPFGIYRIIAGSGIIFFMR
jgi:undecaprenyl-diphosphatase